MQKMGEWERVISATRFTMLPYEHPNPSDPFRARIMQREWRGLAKSSAQLRNVVVQDRFSSMQPHRLSLPSPRKFDRGEYRGFRAISNQKEDRLRCKSR